MAEQPRLWGIDLIGAVYSVAVLMLVLLLPLADGVSLTVIQVLIPVAGLTAIGMFFRIEAIRIALLVLLVLGMIADVFLAIYYLGSALDVFDAPNIRPWRELAKLPVRFGLAVCMFGYLRRADVKNAFSSYN